MTQSLIEWTDRSDWSPVRGCSRVTEACRNCYAEKISGRFCAAGQPFEGFATKKDGQARWTGKVELQTNRLTLPLKWRKAAKIFVNSASDIFHESLPDSDIDKIFAVMALCPQHTFQVLTKRPKRMRDYCNRVAQGNDHIDAAVWRLTCPYPYGGYNTAFLKGSLGEAARKAVKSMVGSPGHPDYWMPNVWLGVSVHDQANADEFVPMLLATPAAKRFVSYEPALGPVDWTNINDKTGGSIESLIGFAWDSCTHIAKIDQIIFGGESGPNARPPHPDWARNTQRQCAAAGTAFYMKQWGEWAEVSLVDKSQEIFDQYDALNYEKMHRFPDGTAMARVGKKRAGRLLDGTEYSEIPQ